MPMNGTPESERATTRVNPDYKRALAAKAPYTFPSDTKCGFTSGPNDTGEYNLTCFENLAVYFSTLVEEEITRARAKFPRPVAGLHEGYAVLLEEVDEFWDEVKAQKPDKELILAELVQIAAMAQRCAEDVLRGR